MPHQIPRIFLMNISNFVMVVRVGSKIRKIESGSDPIGAEGGDDHGRDHHQRGIGTLPADARSEGLPVTVTNTPLQQQRLQAHRLNIGPPQTPYHPASATMG